MVDTIESFYKDKITMLKERVENERFERKVAQQAQAEVSNLCLKFLGSKSDAEGSYQQEKKRAWEVLGAS